VSSAHEVITRTGLIENSISNPIPVLGLRFTYIRDHRTEDFSNLQLLHS